MGLRNTVQQNTRLVKHCGLSAIEAKFREARGDRGPYPINLKAGGIRHRILVRSGTDDLGVLQEIYEQSLYKVPQPFLDRHRGQHVTFVDLGGHIGISALVILSQLKGVASSVTYHLFEPDPQSLEFATVNLTEGGKFDDVDLRFHSKALGIKAGRGVLNAPEGRFMRGDITMLSSNTLYECPDGNVEVVGIPQLSELLNGCQPDGIKIDIEGSEAGLPWGQLIQSPSPELLFMESHESQYPGSSESLISAINSAGLGKVYQNGPNHTYLRY